MRLKSLMPALGAGVLLVGGATAPAVALEPGDSARGTVKIEETELTDAANPNEVKVGCDFSIEFFGMAAGTVPIRFVLMPPSGAGEIFAERTAEVQEAQGKDPSGSLDVDLTEDLRDLPPAQAEDFDYKLKVEAVVKTTSGGAEVTKSAVLFVICEQPAPTTGSGSGGGGNVSGTGGGNDGGGGNGGGGNGGGSNGGGSNGGQLDVAGESNAIPVGGVAAGMGGMAQADAPVQNFSSWLSAAGVLLVGILLSRRLRGQGA